MNLFEKIGHQSISLYLLFFIYNYINFKNNYSLLMSISILINILINSITKSKLIQIMKPYNHTLPILGSFCRPKDKKCDINNVLGYGMPSGHSQIAIFIPAIYFFLYKDFKSFSTPKFLTITVFGLFIITTRYTSRMHSLQQIIVGSFFGFLLAFFSAQMISYFNYIN